MGHRRGRRHNLHEGVRGIREKCFGNQLRNLIRQQFGVCEAETESVVPACVDYLRFSRPSERGPFDISMEVPEGRELRWKVAPRRVASRQVVLSPVAEDDADVWLEQGTRPMQTARAVRLVEQADRAGCTMPLSLLTSLVHLTTRTITSRLRPLWDQGLYLPVLGILQSSRSSLTRLALVLGGHLEGRPPEEIRRSLFLSAGAHGRQLRTGIRVLKGYSSGTEPAEVAAGLGLSPMERDSTLEVIRAIRSSRSAKRRLQSLLETDTESDIMTAPRRATTPSELRSMFEAYLIRRHRFSAARAELLVDAVEQTARQRDGVSRAPTDIVFWAIALGEPAGKARKDCELVAAILPFYRADEDPVPRGTVANLKVCKAVRLATHAYKQGGLLSLSDLAFLLGMGVDSLQKAMSRSKVFLPSRGTIMDIGRGVTHRIEIIRLYVQGYTEPQIVKRTHHAYESVASYVSNFTRVMLLVDRGLPPNHIRKILRMSLRLVNEYIALYRELDVPEHQWKLNLMRRAGEHREKKVWAIQ